MEKETLSKNGMFLWVHLDEMSILIAVSFNISNSQYNFPEYICLHRELHENEVILTKLYINQHSEANAEAYRKSGTQDL